MYQSYDLSRYIDGDLSRSTSFTVSDDDAVNCALMLAAGFNTLNRNMLGDFVLAVVDKKAGVVQYDGKAEQIKRDKPRSYEQTFTFEPSEGDADTILTLFGNGETPTFMATGKLSVDEKSKHARISRPVLESAYDELEAVKEVLADAGVETIPADAGVRDLLAVKSELKVTQRNYRHLVDQNEAARAELIEYVKRAHAKKVKLQTAVPDGDDQHYLDNRWRGMLDVLAKFLVVTGEADASEGHAVARRLCGIED